MEEFFGTPIYRPRDTGAGSCLLAVEHTEPDQGAVRAAIEKNQLLLIQSMDFKRASSLFAELADHYGVGDSYRLQMQYVVHTINTRVPVDDVAVTVNERGPFQVIQSHSEGDSTAQLDLFGLYCVKNSTSGGENILSLINQTADYSRLRAKEKVIIGAGLSNQEIGTLRQYHLDAKRVLEHCDTTCRVLTEIGRGRVVVMPVPIARARSAITGEALMTLWDNVTVHDHAFHRHQYELLRHLGILCKGPELDYLNYMHVEEDSTWAPADSDSGELGHTSRYFTCHVLYKMQPADFLIFHNRAWTHAVNNWFPDDFRQLRAMYA